MGFQCETSVARKRRVLARGPLLFPESESQARQRPGRAAHGHQLQIAASRLHAERILQHRVAAEAAADVAELQQVGLPHVQTGGGLPGATEKPPPRASRHLTLVTVGGTDSFWGGSPRPPSPLRVFRGGSFLSRSEDRPEAALQATDALGLADAPQRMPNTAVRDL